MSELVEAPVGARTAEAEIRRAALICERAAAGDLEARITDIVDPDSDLGRLFRSINRVLDTADSYVRESTAAMQCCAAEKFHRPILLRGMPGAYRNGSAIINRAIQTMKRSCDRIGELEEQRHRLADEFEARVLESVSVVASAATQVEATAREIGASSRANVGLVQSLHRIADEASRAVSEGSRRCAAVNGATTEIEKVLSTIDQITSQTKLLALNASIEAARAGNAGRGFEVVASEVRKLAETTMGATHSVHDQLEALQGATGDALTSMASIQSVIGGDANPADADRTHDDMRRSVAAISEASSTATDAAEQMAQASGELSRLSETLRADVAAFLEAIRSGDGRSCA
ncbi:MAG: hypothetical protein KDB80_14900 [Planctomycetes bacterium]|nr:hypothetical protein [Planctomycetota bacterium]